MKCAMKVLFSCYDVLFYVFVLFLLKDWVGADLSYNSVIGFINSKGSASFGSDNPQGSMLLTYLTHSAMRVITRLIETAGLKASELPPLWYRLFICLSSCY